MGSRFLFALVLTGTFTSLGASYRTPNFVVDSLTVVNIYINPAFTILTTLFEVNNVIRVPEGFEST